MSENWFDIFSLEILDFALTLVFSLFYPIRLQRQEELYALGHQSLMQEGEFKAQMMLMT